MCYNAGIVDYEQMGRGKRYTRNSTMKEYNFDEIVSKGWEPKPKHKKLTPEMEEDIDSAVADNEFAVSNKLSDETVGLSGYYSPHHASLVVMVENPVIGLATQDRTA
jgi:hypothetical protein